ncbi:MAG: type II secretion system protein GspM [Lachnospiraceae bacterium]|nr:type II secretion system protein GspM [Lachnospiraceae bacterium]MDD7627978.1 type II secretion system protein GspM [Lachnospiraceae bacterium]MDY4119759.1 type II secretion system protein GspM [Lachnospiraceae bacterium]
MKLSERDRKLLLILVIVIIVCVPYFFIIQPLMDKVDSLGKEISDLNAQVKYREELALMEEEYGKAAEQMAAMETELLSKFPSDLPQEASILFIHNTEQVIPISLYQVAFGDDVAAQVTSTAEEQAIEDVEAETGDTTQTEVIEDNTQTTSLGLGLTGIQTQTRFAYDAGYEEFKDFLKYIADYHDRMVITELEASYSGEMNLVSGNLTLSQYALKGEGRNTVQFLEPNMIQGTTNVFKQASGNFDTTEVAASPDFFILLNQPGADVDAIIVGQSNDVTESTYLSSTKNAKQEVNIYFEGETGKYNAYYEIGKTKYDDAGVDFDKDGNIELQIISSSRLDDSDKVEISLNIYNTSDAIVKVTTLNDDAEKPRVTIKGTEGDIIIN